MFKKIIEWERSRREAGKSHIGTATLAVGIAGAIIFKNTLGVFALPIAVLLGACIIAYLTLPQAKHE